LAVQVNRDSRATKVRWDFKASRESKVFKECKVNRAYKE
jgi:hypothetical protein